MAYMREGGLESNVMETKSGGGCLMVFGLPFLLMGLGVMISPTGIIPAKNAPPPWYFAVPFGLVFAAVGAAFVFGRGGVRIDRTQRTVTTWWGLLVPFKKTEHGLDEYDHVGLTKEIRRSKNSTYTVYPVKLLGRGKEVGFGEPREYQAARRKAEEIAGFLGLRMMDATSGKAVWRKPEEFDESLRERVRRTGKGVEVPDPPTHISTKVRIEGRQVVLDLPREGCKAQHVAGALVGAAMVAGAVCFFAVGPFRDALKEPPPMRYFVIGFASLFVLFPLLVVAGAVAGAFRRERVIASAEGLRHQRRGLVFTRTKYIAAEEMEELALPNLRWRSEAAAQIEKLEAPAIVKGIARSLARRRGRERGIQARSDKTVIEFGRGLGDEELVWLHAVVMKMMTV